MSKKTKRAKHKKNNNYKRKHSQRDYNALAATIEMWHMEPEDVNRYIDNGGLLEQYPGPSWGFTKEHIDCNCYVMDVSPFKRLTDEPWKVVHWVACQCVSAGMRVFPSEKLLIIATPLDEHGVAAVIEPILESVRTII